MLSKVHETVEMGHAQRLEDDRSLVYHENSLSSSLKMERFLHQPNFLNAGKARFRLVCSKSAFLSRSEILL